MMRIQWKFVVVLILAAGMMLSGGAQAGRSCEGKKLSVQTIERSLTLAGRAVEALDASGQKVVMMARAGQDLSKYGVHYSHVGIVYQEPDGKGGHVWRVLHELNHCGTSDSALYRQGIGDFFLDDLWRYEAAYAILAPEVQDRVLAMMADSGKSVRMHQNHYSVVSYAWGQKYQQSNQWAIESLAAAMDSSIGSRQQAQSWLRARGYEPAVLTIGPLTRLGGRISAANVAFDDHPFEKRFSDRIETITVDSVFAWLQRSRLGSAPLEIRLRP